ILGALLVCSTLLAQSRNVALKSTVSPTSRYNDIWGYHDKATGREAAILGASGGIYIYETTNPAAPVRRGYFSASSIGWRSCTWNDMKEWKGYAYAVSECGSGLAIIDLRNLSAPRYVKRWGTTYWSHAHNVGMDRDRGILCVHGTGGSRSDTIRFVDVNTDPENPRLLASWTTAYIHDMSWQDNLLHAGNIYAGNYSLYDTSLSMSSPRLLGSVRTPKAFTHNTWPSYDNKICVTTDEKAAGPMGIYDISARGNPVYRASYQTGGSRAIVHNAFLLDYVAHISYYTEGYRAVDVSNPRSPVEVGFYDTYPGSSSGYNGAWGCYPFQPSGNIYISDIQRGLFVLKPRAGTTRYGSGTAGTGNTVPRVHTIGSAYVGNSNFTLGVRDAKGMTPAVMLLGAGRANLNIGNSGLYLHVSLVPGPVVLASATNGAGATLLRLGIPNDSTLNSLKLNVQWFVFDTNGKLDLASSQGLEFEVFNK
ncbi:MAG: choice-of-anchor B family protein, partial [Planctomycetota bacterium]|nr:choice-of-anchor B family protein [Planctomycetota bacterium]